MLLSVLAGCSVKFGRIPPVDKLHTSLRPMVDSKSDVLKALGVPRGYGMARMPSLPDSPYSIWFYEYVAGEARTGKITLKMLLVFFDREKYVGYLWFSSLEKVKK